MNRLSAHIRQGNTFTVHADSLDETLALGQNLGELIHSGMTITLTGGLGSGKTSFVQGLAKGLGVPDEYYITSPTYTIINEYPGRIPLYHVDLYRISDPCELEDIGFDEILEEGGVIAVEWPERIPEGILEVSVGIDIDIQDDDTRNFSFLISCMDLHK